MSSSNPTVTCSSCGNVQIVWMDGRGFPPDIAKRKLRRQCQASGCVCAPVYRAAVVVGHPPTGQ